MTDLVERLRHIHDLGMWRIMREAADEIERLRELRATDLELREADLAEIERLCAALDVCKSAGKELAFRLDELRGKSSD